MPVASDSPSIVHVVEGEAEGLHRREEPVTGRGGAAGGRRDRLAVTATTLSLVVIFVAVAFMTGQIGQYFYSFGITSAASILISMFVAFTLAPALCATRAAPPR